jgi:integrase
VFNWAVKTRKIASNPFEATTVAQPRKIRTRETDEFTPAEVKLILASALMFKDTMRPFDAARRWVPWLCAYTGARAGEITQLRGADLEAWKAHG